MYFKVPQRNSCEVHDDKLGFILDNAYCVSGLELQGDTEFGVGKSAQYSLRYSECLMDRSSCSQSQNDTLKVFDHHSL
jgi:hypothetical protein